MAISYDNVSRYDDRIFVLSVLKELSYKLRVLSCARGSWGAVKLLFSRGFSRCFQQLYCWCVPQTSFCINLTYTLRSTMSRWFLSTDFKSLRLCDQMSLLRSTWLDIVCLNITYRSLPYDGDIVYADDFKVSEEDSSLFGATLELDYVMRRLIRKLSDVKLTYEEYLLLKALLLFNPGCSLIVWNCPWKWFWEPLFDRFRCQSRRCQVGPAAEG